jgi:hypothetical protein
MLDHLTAHIDDVLARYEQADQQVPEGVQR